MKDFAFMLRRKALSQTYFVVDVLSLTWSSVDTRERPGVKTLVRTR